jgi:dihydroneopterin aldolase
MATLKMVKMKFYGHHGVTEEEREKGGEYEVDCEIETDISGCAAGDDIQDAVDYSAVYAIIREHVENRRYNLMETLAEKLKSEIMEKIGVKKIKLRVRKLKPPVGGKMAYFEVEVSE